jgi:hypothetical protein
MDDITQLQRMVAALVELVELQGKRIDRLEAELAARDSTFDVFQARQAAEMAAQLARGAAVLATR